jgi:hypothetical protein
MILEIVISLLAVAGFGLVLWWSRIVQGAHGTMNATMAGLSAMMDGELDDDAKELAVRRAGFNRIFASFSIFWRFCVAVLAAAAPILLADGIGLVSRDAVLKLMLRLDYIIVVSVVAIVLAEIFRRRRPAAAETARNANRYSMADRFFHVLAFSSPAVLKAASRLEDRLLSQPIKDPSSPPIFITSLARGGITAVLNAMHDIPDIHPPTPIATCRF